MVPDFGIAGRELAPVCKGGLHRRIGVTVEKGYLVPAIEKGIGRRDAGDAGADNCKMRHCRFLPRTR